MVEVSECKADMEQLLHILIKENQVLREQHEKAIALINKLAGNLGLPKGSGIPEISEEIQKHSPWNGKS